MMSFAQLLPSRSARAWLFAQVQSWLWILLAMAFYSMTITYASHSETVCSQPATGASATSVFRALSFLVVLNSFSLGAVVRTAFGKLPSWLISRSGRLGLSGVDYLALQPGTSALGHLKIIHWHEERRYLARVWSALRLIVTAALPLSTFLILST
jgi:hypothetical protein